MLEVDGYESYVLLESQVMILAQDLLVAGIAVIIGNVCRIRNGKNKALKAQSFLYFLIKHSINTIQVPTLINSPLLTSASK